MAGKIFAMLGVMVVGMLITGAASESFGPGALLLLVPTTMAVFWLWGRKPGERSD